ncbi:MAG: hypothetical protein ACP5DX_12440 [Paracoccaceae bacterium]
MNRAALDAALLAAHAAGDRAALVAHYTRAAEIAGDAAAEGFFLTHAYIYALEAGHAEAPALHARLKAAGRED